MERLTRPIVVAVAAFAVGFLFARMLDAPIMTTGRADTKEGGGGSISTDDWTYGFQADVPWTDANGAWNEGIPPGCLVPGESVNVRFAATEVSVEGVTWRPVVWVDCRSASSGP